MQLVIVESPTKARTLERFLGKDYQIMASMGHVRDLPKKKLGVDIDHGFEPEYEVVLGKKKTVSAIRQAAVKASSIILATDPDREGEAIAYHLLMICSGSKFRAKGQAGKVQSSKFKRITFHEITKSAVEEALRHPGEVRTILFEAQQARRVLDRLVGYKLSPLLWRKIRRGLSAGRVQSVAVRLIVERERKIAAFKPEDYWEFFARLYPIKKDDFFTAKLLKIDGKNAVVKTKKQAGDITSTLNKAAYRITDLKQEQLLKNPPPPFITSTLQRTAANLYRFSAKKTMTLAQRLYEAGLITYHRTDSVKLSAQAIDKLRTFIQEQYGSKYLSPQPRQYKTTTKSAQEAHEAIRPTKLVHKRRLSSDETRLFELVKNRALCTQMAAAVYQKIIVDVVADKIYLLRKVCQQRRFDGYLKVWSKKDEAGDPESAVVNKLAVDTRLYLNELITEAKQTEPPPRYTEASLIKALEDRGIGRPSTYAPIITTIQVRNYVEKQEGRFIPTPVGMTVTEFLEKHFNRVMDYQFTAQMEDNLDAIAIGKIKWQEVIGDFYEPFAKRLEKVSQAKRVAIPTEKTGAKCPECKKGDQVIRVGRFGRFLSCSRFPDCKWKDTYKEVVKNFKCPDCGSEILVRQTRHGKRFYGCSAYPKCRFATWRLPKLQS